jgi:hypothetical protein
MRKAVWGLLVFTTLGGMLCLYSVAFSYWMMADPLYDSPGWHTHFDHMLFVTALDALLWIGSVVWLGRHRRTQTAG